MSSGAALREEAFRIWRAGVDAVLPERLVARHLRVEDGWLRIGGSRLPLSEVGRIAVVGAGKAAAGMARGVVAALGPDVARRHALGGLVNVLAEDSGTAGPVVLHAARAGRANEPTEAAVEGALRIEAIAAALGPRDLLLCVVSGGGSALLSSPVPGVSLEDERAVARALQSRGADIRALNAVRKHLSRLSGGGLARRAGAGRVAALILSDVVGDPLDGIASGPTAPDPTTYADALDVLARHGLGDDDVPAAVLAHLRAGAEGRREETPKSLPAHVTNHLIGHAGTALDAAAAEARARGYAVVDLGADVQGDTGDAARLQAGLLREIRGSGRPAPPPVCVLSGGETTVSLGAAPGLGGRNQEFALEALCELGEDGLRDAVLLSAGTDGEDGPTDAAGAFADADAVRAAARRGLDPRRFLAAHDAYAFFDSVGALLRTGRTGTNVMDLRVLLVAAGC